MLAVLVLCVAWVAPTHAQATPLTSLPARIAKVLGAHKVPLDAVSVLVQAVDEASPRLAVNIDVPRNPASTVKLVTTWVALDLLGPTHTWATRLYALGPIEKGVLRGDLLIKGSGDPYILLEDMWKMLGELRRLGVREITGDLVLDNSLFDVIESDPAAFDGAGFRLYNVLPSALMVNFKAINFMFNTDAAGKLRISTQPPLENLKITNHIKLVGGECRRKGPKIVMASAAPETPDHVVFSGEMPRSCRHYQIPRSAMTAQSYTFGVFKLLWAQWGGTIGGSFREAPLTSKCRPLLTWRSDTLAEIVRPLNKWSNNLMTRMLLYAIGETRYPTPITRAEGANALRAHLESRGLDTSQLIIDNGSGLSRDTRVTSRFMASLLRHAWFEPTMPEFVASLAIAGIDGTARKRFRGAKQSGRMHLKTGSIHAVSAVGGYVHTAGGRTFLVSVLANRRGINYGVGTEIQNAVLAWTFEQQ